MKIHTEFFFFWECFGFIFQILILCVYYDYDLFGTKTWLLLCSWPVFFLWKNTMPLRSNNQIPSRKISPIAYALFPLQVNIISYLRINFHIEWNLVEAVRYDKAKLLAHFICHVERGGSFLLLLCRYPCLSKGCVIASFHVGTIIPSLCWKPPSLWSYVLLVLERGLW